MKATVVGNYPKISSDARAPNLRHALNRLERGRIGPLELEEVYLATLRRVLDEQAEAGIDLLTDGQIRWDDLVTPLARDVASLHGGGLVRFFDNNVYYRRPVVTGRLWFRGSSLAEQYRQAAGLASRPVKAVLPGPYTAACLVEDDHYRDRERLVADLADNLHLEARALVEAGARHLQLDEPALAFHGEDWALARDGVARVVSGLVSPAGTLETSVFVYFRDPAPLLERLAEFPVDVVGLDLATGRPTGAGPGAFSPAARALALDGYPKGVVLGCVDGREVRLESTGELASLFEAIAPKVRGPLRASPSCGLEFLPHDRARAKLQRLGEAVRAFSGASGGAVQGRGVAR